MAKIIILSEEDYDAILEVLVHKEAFFKDAPATWETSKKWGRLAELFEKAPTEHTIRIVVHGGCVQDVENMPMDFYYEVQDFDNCSECGGLDPECERCKEF